MAASYVNELRKLGTRTPKGLLQFQGVSYEQHEKVMVSLDKARYELFRLKMNGPFVEDRERLVFYRKTIGTAEIKGVMTQMGPVFSWNGILVPWDQRWVYSGIGLDFSKTPNGWQCGAFHMTARINPDIYDLQTLGAVGDIGIRSCPDSDILAFCEETGSRWSRPEEEGEWNDGAPFRDTPVCKVDLKAWIEREPLLAEECRRNPLFGRGWYEAAMGGSVSPTHSREP